MTFNTQHLQRHAAAASLRANLSDELLLLGRVRHVVVDVSEELLQSLFGVLLSRRLAPLLLRVRTRNGRPLQGQRSALARRPADCRHLQIVLSRKQTVSKHSEQQSGEGTTGRGTQVDLGGTSELTLVCRVLDPVK